LATIRDFSSSTTCYAGPKAEFGQGGHSHEELTIVFAIRVRSKATPIKSTIRITAGGITALLIAANTPASEPHDTVRFSGTVLSSTGELPNKLSAFADCADDRPRILGKVENGIYEINLPAGVECSVHIGEQNWDAQPLSVTDAVNAMRRPALVYPRKVPEPAIARELMRMKEQDQAERDLVKPGSPPEAVARIKARDSARQQRLAEIIATKGWPTAPMVGWQAADAAWVIAQHADDRPAFQKEALALMEKEASRRGLPIDTNIAYLIDRIAVAEHRPQLYGTQLTMPTAAKPCDIDFLPLDNRDRVDERRRAIGLVPLDAYRRSILMHINCANDTSSSD
jgi:hypothetical protein